LLKSKRLKSLRSGTIFIYSTLAIFLFGMAFGIAANAQDTSRTITIEIMGARQLIGTETATGSQKKLIGDVNLKQGDSYMSSDSAYIDEISNNVEAFGNVVITQPGGTRVQSDYLRYTGNTKQAYLKGNVSLTDGKNNLWSEDLDYDLGTKIGKYSNGGTLQSESTTLSSNSGMYNVKTKDSRFTGDVFVTDPRYEATSSDLGYNTESKLVRFYGPSDVINDRSHLVTSSGTWDAKNEVAHFRSRSSIQNVDQYIEADTMDYDRKTGFGVAVGNVVGIDTGRKTTLWCGYAQYNEITRKMLTAIKPVMRQMNGDDSLFIKADTFFSAPIPRPSDTLRRDSLADSTIVKGRLKITKAAVPADTIDADSTRPRYFIGYHHVLVFSDSLQARCDSISYSQKDSVMKMMYDPIAWSRSSQITGDTILLYLDTSSLNRLYVPNNALIVSLSGPPKAGLYDQVQGKTLTGYFEKNAITTMIVWPNAEAIYYGKDESGAYLGVNQAQSERMKVFFSENKIRRILFEQEVKQTMTPLQQINIQTTRLSRFQWLDEKRPKKLQELFD
jgi:lipopolysaccharide export system protein LptA